MVTYFNVLQGGNTHIIYHTCNVGIPILAGGEEHEKERERDGGVER